MADLTIDTATDAVRDAFYVAVGAGVIAFQKLQVQRVELTKTLSSQLADAKGTAEKSLDGAKDSFEAVQALVEERVKQLETRLEGLEERLETVLAQIEAQLPEQARDLVKQARELVGRAA